MKYIKIRKNKISRYFEVFKSVNGKYVLRRRRGVNTIKINLPFVLDEDCASLAGMMPDGSLIRDLNRIYFHQKKDINKNYLFKQLLEKKFHHQTKFS